MAVYSPHNVKKGFFEYEEFFALRDALPYYLKPVVTFACFAGWRREEIMGLWWKQVVHFRRKK